MYREHPGRISKNLNRHLKEKYKVICKHVIGNDAIPYTVRREILWKYHLQEGLFAVQEGRSADAFRYAWYCGIYRPFHKASLSLGYRALTSLLLPNRRGSVL